MKTKFLSLFATAAMLFSFAGFARADEPVPVEPAITIDFTAERNGGYSAVDISKWHFQQVDATTWGRSTWDVQSVGNEGLYNLVCVIEDPSLKEESQDSDLQMVLEEEPAMPEATSVSHKDMYALTPMFSKDGDTKEDDSVTFELRIGSMLSENVSLEKLRDGDSVVFYVGASQDATDWVRLGKYAQYTADETGEALYDVVKFSLKDAPDNFCIKIVFFRECTNLDFDETMNAFSTCVMFKNAKFYGVKEWEPAPSSPDVTVSATVKNATGEVISGVQTENTYSYNDVEGTWKVVFASEDGNDIYYTLNGTDPNDPDNNRQKYASEISVLELFGFDMSSGESIAVQVRAFNASEDKYSDMITVALNPKQQAPAIAEPYFTDKEGVKITGDMFSPYVFEDEDTIKLVCSTEGVTLYYTLDIEADDYGFYEHPQTSGTAYDDAAGIKVTASGDVYAVAVKEGEKSQIAILTVKNQNEKLPVPTFWVQMDLSVAAQEYKDGDICYMAEGATPIVTLQPLMAYNFRYTMEDDVELSATSGKDYYGTGNAPINITGPCTLRAIQVTMDNEISEVSTLRFVVGEDPGKLSKPYFTVDGVVVESPYAYEDEVELHIACSVADAKIYYTQEANTWMFDSDPVTYGTLYDDAKGIKLTKTGTLKAVAVKDAEKSDFVTFEYKNVNARPAKPMVSVTVDWTEWASFTDDSTYYIAKDVDTAFVRLSVASMEEMGAKIRYTFDDQEQLTDSSTGIGYSTGNLVVTESCTLRALAYKDGKVSDVITLDFVVGEPAPEKPAAPTFSLSGEVKAGDTLRIDCATEGAEIFYAMDTAAFVAYTDGIVITKSVKVRAYAKKGNVVSDTTEVSLTVAVSLEGRELAGVSVYPNPSNGRFNVSVPVDGTLEVFCGDGRLVMRRLVVCGEMSVEIGQSGVYFVRVRATNGQVAVRKVVVR